MTAPPVNAYAVLWAEGRLPGVVCATWRDAQTRARALRKLGTPNVRIARVTIIEQTEEAA